MEYHLGDTPEIPVGIKLVNGIQGLTGINLAEGTS